MLPELAGLSDCLPDMESGGFQSGFLGAPNSRFITAGATDVELRRDVVLVEVAAGHVENMPEFPGLLSEHCHPTHRSILPLRGLGRGDGDFRVGTESTAAAVELVDLVETVGTEAEASGAAPKRSP